MGDGYVGYIIEWLSSLFRGSIGSQCQLGMPARLKFRKARLRLKGSRGRICGCLPMGPMGSGIRTVYLIKYKDGVGYEPDTHTSMAFYSAE